MEKQLDKCHTKTKKHSRLPKVHWKPNLEQGWWCCITRLELLKPVQFIISKIMVQFVDGKD